MPQFAIRLDPEDVILACRNYAQLLRSDFRSDAVVNILVTQNDDDSVTVEAFVSNG